MRVQADTENAQIKDFLCVWARCWEGLYVLNCNPHQLMYKTTQLYLALY